MQIQSSRHLTKRKLGIAVSLLVVLLALAVGAYAYYQQSGQNADDGGIDLGAPTKEQTKGEDTSEQSKDDDETGQADPDTDKPGAPDSNLVTTTITTANQYDNTVQIRAIIDKITNEGTCKLSLTKEGKNSYTQEVGVSASSTYSVCKGFDVNTSKLSAGTWNVQVAYSNGNQEGAATDTVTVE